MLGREKPDIINFAKQTLKSFQELPFCEVDSVIFCSIAYFNIHKEEACCHSDQGMPLKALLKAEHFDEMVYKVWHPEEMLELLFAVAASPRYRDVVLRYYQAESDKNANLQFSAMVFSISEDCHYIAYRGTDWTIVGWKEDFLLALSDPVKAQVLALEYLEKAGEKLPGKIYVGGHSKGGNLAVYAASSCTLKLQDRIETVFSHDGPGFLKGMMDEEGFQRIRGRIEKTIPQNSLFGRIFETECRPKVIQSNEIGVMQHLSLSWEVSGNKLKTGEECSALSSSIIKKMNQWIDSMDNEERLFFIRTSFQLVDEMGIETIDEFWTNMHTYVSAAIKALSKLDSCQRKEMSKALHILLFGTRNANISLEGLERKYRKAFGKKR